MSERRNAHADLAKCEAATPGPWEICLGSGENVCTWVCHYGEDGGFVFVADCLPDNALDCAPKDHVPNMELIAMCRQALPHYIRECQRLREALRIADKSLRQSLKDWAVANKIIEDKQFHPFTLVVEEIQHAREEIREALEP